MSTGNANHASVRHALLAGKKVPECLATLDNVCATGEQCAEVQGSPATQQALVALQAAVKTANASLASKLSLAQALLAAAKALNLDFGAAQLALRSYEASVDALANGNAKIINKAGLLSRTKTTPAELGPVAVVRSKPGKHPAEAVLSWPAGPGATSYAIEVNFTPQDPSAPWIALKQGSSRRRVVKAPTPASQFLAHVASIAGDGTQSEWSDAILATTL
jgi:hypothetical protein